MVVTNSTDVFTYDETVMEGGRTFKVSFLQLCSVDMATDAGAYECYATNGNAMANASTWLTITRELCNCSMGQISFRCCCKFNFIIGTSQSILRSYGI